MKLKYYLRGLGIGMLVAALILTISGKTDSKMSDEAIKRRAAELGMVEKDKTVLGEIGSAADSGENATEPEGGEAETQDSVSGQAVEPEASAEHAPEPKEDVSGQPETEPVVEDKDERELVQEIEERADEVADRAGDVAENAPAGRIVMLEVRRGDSSVSVARRAAEAGLVQSAADFDVFLCRNGYDKRISIGNYEITEGASEEEIADIITKSR